MKLNYTRNQNGLNFCLLFFVVLWPVAKWRFYYKIDYLGGRLSSNRDSLGLLALELLVAELILAAVTFAAIIAARRLSKSKLDDINFWAKLALVSIFSIALSILAVVFGDILISSIRSQHYEGVIYGALALVVSALYGSNMFFFGVRKNN